jgi:hypothetical protein
MPIEIRELHIKMNVTAHGGGAGGANPPAAAGGAGANAEAQRVADDALVTRCVEQVMDLLRNRTER